MKCVEKGQRFQCDVYWFVNVENQLIIKIKLSHLRLLLNARRVDLNVMQIRVGAGRSDYKNVIVLVRNADHGRWKTTGDCRWPSIS